MRPEAAASPRLLCLSSLQVWRPAEGFGIRLDGGNAYSGATISPHYDSMLMKVLVVAATLTHARTHVRAACRGRLSLTLTHTLSLTLTRAGDGLGA